MNGILISLLSAIATCFVFCFCSSLSFGECPNSVYERQNDYKMDALYGIWYENATYNKFVGETGRCGKYMINLKPNDLYGFVYEETKKGKTKTYTGELMKVNYDFKFYKYVVNFGNVVAHMWMMDTDYTCWAVIFFCRDKTFSHSYYLSVLLRSRKPDCLNEKTTQAVDAVLKHEELSLTMFTYNSQEGCNS